MVSDEQVSVVIKHKDANSDLKWKAPDLADCNVIPNWTDANGAVIRRLPILAWSEMITDRDPSLKGKIISTELVTILLRCVACFCLACAQFESKEFWDPHQSCYMRLERR